MYNKKKKNVVAIDLAAWQLSSSPIVGLGLGLVLEVPIGF